MLQPISPAVEATTTLPPAEILSLVLVYVRARGGLPFDDGSPYSSLESSYILPI